MKVNITLITRDRPLLVTQTLMSMLSTNVKADLTIVDDGSSFEVVGLLETCCNLMISRGWEVNLIHNDTPSKNAGVTRNQAINAVKDRGNFLYCTDNDCYFHPGWLEALLDIWPEAKRAGFAVIGGYNHPFHQPLQVKEIAFGDGQECSGKMITNSALSSQSWFMEWRTWDRFGPLVEEKEHDQAFCNKIDAAGFRVGKIRPAVVVNTGLTNSTGELVPGAEYIRKEIPQGVYFE